MQRKPDGEPIKEITKNGKWKDHTYTIMEDYNIQPDSPNETAKTMVENKNKQDIIHQVEQEALTKSKFKRWLEKQDMIKSGKRQDSMNKLKQNQCAAMKGTRTRMLPTKESHK